MKHFRFAVAAFLLIPLAASAATYIVPPDERLVADAAAIVVATALGSAAALTPGGGIVTTTDFVIDEVVKGDLFPGDRIAVTEPGGILGSVAMIIPGSPAFATGEEVLLFLTRGRNGSWTTLHLELGKFRFVVDVRGRELLVRGNGGEVFGWTIDGKPHDEQPRLADRFLQFVRARSRGMEAPARPYLLDERHPTESGGAFPRFEASAPYDQSLATSTFSPGTYQMTLGDPQRPARRPSFGQGVVFTNFGTQAGAVNGGVDGIIAGLAVWTDEPNSSVAYSYGGFTEDSTGRSGCDTAATVVFNDPNNEIDGTFGGSGTLAIGGFCATLRTHTHGGDTFYGITDVDVVLQDNLQTWEGIGRSEFRQLMAHELGHTLGFRHSNQNGTGGECAPPLECTIDAVMRSTIRRLVGETLQPYDVRAVQTVYGAPPCNLPVITTQPSSVRIVSGGQATLTVAATSDSGVSYTWYQGAAGDVSQPVATAATLTTPPLTTTTSYWVLVTNVCGDAQSSTATVNVGTAPRKRAVRRRD